MLEAKEQVFFKEKKVFNKLFSGDLYKKQKKSLEKYFVMQYPIEENKKGLHKVSARFLALSNKISTVQTIVLISSRGQGSFRGLEASRPRT